MCRLLLIVLLAVVFHAIDGTIAYFYCTPEQVLIADATGYSCFDKCADCPNGYCEENECRCFPGMRRDLTGVCGKICPNCENGWCSSSSRCECNEGFRKSRGLCVQIRYQPNQQHSFSGEHSHQQQNHHQHSVPWHHRHSTENNQGVAPPRREPTLSTQSTNFRRQDHPQIPLRFGSHRNEQVPVQEQYSTQSLSRLHLQRSPQQPRPESRPRSNPGPFQPPLSADRSDRPYTFEKIDAQVVLAQLPSRSCQTDFLWDPETEACIPYESAKVPEMNIRMDD